MFNLFFLKVLAEKIGTPFLTLKKYLFSDLSKRRVSGDGVGGKSLLHRKYYDFSGQVATRYDRVNNGLARREMIELVKELNLHLDRPAASRQVSRHIIPNEKHSGYIKVFVTTQSTTTDRSAITVDQQFQCHNLVEDQYKILKLRNDGVCPVSGKYFGKIMP